MSRPVRRGAVGKGPVTRHLVGGLPDCTYDFFAQCPHRMACARCGFYVPKGSARAQLVEGKTNLLRMKQELALTDEELAAVDEGVQLHERLLARLAEDAPSAEGKAPRWEQRGVPLPVLPAPTTAKAATS